MKRIYQVHMLPTDQPSSPLGKYKDTGNLVLNSRVGDIDRGEPQHLHITSDEEIRIGDWVYDTDSLPHNPLVHRIWKVYDKHFSFDRHLHTGVDKPFESGNKFFKTNYRKIVATTNKELWERTVRGEEYLGGGSYTRTFTTVNKGIHQIPFSFVEEYVKRGGIKEVMLEMENNQYWKDLEGKGKDIAKLVDNWKLKLTPSGEVIWSLPEQKWDKNKVIRAMFHLNKDLGINLGEELILKWFDKNYPLEECLKEEMYTRNQLWDAITEALSFNDVSIEQPTRDWFDSNYPPKESL